MRYKNSVLGFFWSLLNPLGMMLVFSIIFTLVMPNNAIENYPIFVLCGILPWNFFTSGVMSGTNSIIGNGNLVKKAYFPRTVLPIASVLANLVNFLLAMFVLFVMLIVLHGRLSPYLWLLPVVILIETAFIAGMALVLGTLTVFYRDTLMVLDTVLLAWFFLTPVVYSITVLPATQTILGVEVHVRRLMYILNPMASLVSAFRDIIYWGYRTNLDFLLRTAVTAGLILAFGFWFCIRYSARFSEEI